MRSGFFCRFFFSYATHPHPLSNHTHLHALYLILNQAPVVLPFFLGLSAGATEQRRAIASMRYSKAIQT